MAAVQWTAEQETGRNKEGVWAEEVYDVEKAEEEERASFCVSEACLLGLYKMKKM